VPQHRILVLGELIRQKYSQQPAMAAFFGSHVIRYQGEPLGVDSISFFLAKRQLSFNNAKISGCRF
jgi:hypothetical protein